MPSKRTLWLIALTLAPIPQWNFCQQCWCEGTALEHSGSDIREGFRIGGKDDSSPRTIWPEGTDNPDGHRRIMPGYCWRTAIIGSVDFPSERAGTRGLPSGRSAVLPSRIAAESRRHVEHYRLSTGESDKDQSYLSERTCEERSINSTEW